MRLVWASTENLGPWPVVRRRIEDELQRKISAPLGEGLESSATFDPFEAADPQLGADHFMSFANKALQNAERVGWSPEHPARLVFEGASFRWPLPETELDRKE